MASRKILMTCALPYANGSIHLGHMLEHIQADIWIRFQKMSGHEAYFFCADDTHGTPVMISARDKGITPEELIEKMKSEHIEDLTGFEVSYDNYHSTHSVENKELAQEFFVKMKDQGLISEKEIEQAYCNHDQMFLPDRFVKGTCPNCGAEDQYGDSCEVCSATYNSTEMPSRYCVLCKNTPVEQKSLHLFFDLKKHQEFLKSWLSGHTQEEVANKMMEWFDGELRAWDISRDKPYFGIEIPGYKDKYFYVWMDAPVGYISSSKNWADRNGKDFNQFWKGEYEIHHFIGKDITYFHTLFWPAMLKSAGYETPTYVHVHGFVKVNGEKMSKSKGTFLNASTYLKYADPLYLRYYYASKLSKNVSDVDLNLEDFAHRVNAELIGKITNLASRGAQMLGKKLDGVLSTCDEEGLKIVQQAQGKSKLIAQLYDEKEFSKVVQEIRGLAEEGNRYFDEREPWKSIKESPDQTKQVLSSILNLFRIISIYLKPILPNYVSQVEALFGEDSYSWSDAEKILENHKINKFQHLAKRLELKQLEDMVAEEKSNFEKQNQQKEAH